MEAGLKLTTVGLLRLLGAGANGPIVTALGSGPLRTKELTERVMGYTPRTVYRYSRKLTEAGILERHEEPGVPSKVVHSLTEPCGRELFELIETYADASLTRLPNGEFDAHAWGSLGLLADLWESGLIEMLNLRPRTPSELARIQRRMTYHQVNRRVALFATTGFLEAGTTDRGRAYSLTSKARRGMALIAGIGRWRRRHVVDAGSPGLTPREVAGVLRTALPLVMLPDYAGKGLGIEIASEAVEGGEGDAVWASVGKSGAVHSCEHPPSPLDGQVRDRGAALVDALLDGPRHELKASGDGHLIEACLERLHAALWGAWPAGSPSPAEAVAGGRDGA